MRGRIHLFEFGDQPWVPRAFRRIQTDYLQFVATLGAGHANLVPLFRRALQHAGTSRIVDLCSGGSGPWLRLAEHLRRAGLPVQVTLTDKYPDPAAVGRWAAEAREGIEYRTEPVDALSVPPHLEGMRTLFEGFHHFRPEQARAILQSAADARAAIGVFEASLRPPLGLLLLPLAPVSTLLGYFVFTPFIRPRRLSRFLWTYLLPLVPLATCWDGIVSLLRVYSPAELDRLARSVRCENYAWESSWVPAGAGPLVFTVLVGYPVAPAAPQEARSGGSSA